MAKDVILQHNGVLEQETISTYIDTLETNITNLNLLGKVVTVSIELLQNMMVYSKSVDQLNNHIVPAGDIEVNCDNNIYNIISKNIVSLDDKQKIEFILETIKTLDQKGIRKRYKELRRSGENAHDNNAGIGFYEIIRHLTTFGYNFEQINNTRYYFEFFATIAPKKVNNI